MTINLLKKVLFLFLFGSFGSSLMASEYEHNWARWRDMVLHDPSGALNIAREVKTEWKEHELSRAFVQDGLSRCPFFILNECFDASCPLNRQFDFRELSQKIVINNLLNAIDKSPDKKIHYVSFASGELFFDLVVLVNVFSLRPDSRIDFSAIDPAYNPRVSGVQVDLGPNIFAACIQGMFPEATFSIRLIDNGAIPSTQLIDMLENPAVIVAIDVGASGYSELTNGHIYYDRLWNFIKVKYPLCRSVYVYNDFRSTHNVETVIAQGESTEKKRYLVNENGCAFVA